MKKKIEKIFVCLLLISLLVPATTIRAKNENQNSLKSLSEFNCTKLCNLFTSGTPNDPGFKNQWYLHSEGKIFWCKILLVNNKIPFWFPFRVKPGIDIQALEAWDIETGSPDVVIAIPDSGVDYTNPDLEANIWKNVDEIPKNGIDDDRNGYVDDVMGWDFENNDNDPMDDNNHGTGCASIACAVGNNEIGMIGVAWNCKVMALKVWDNNGGGSWENMAQAIRYAVNNGAKIISMSSASTEAPDVLLDAVNYAYGKGVFLCAGAGNSGQNIKEYPAAYENVTAVGMTSTRDEVRKTSTFGEWVDIAAPGQLIYCASVSHGYSNPGGTSAATPMVAGVAALLLSKNPSLTPDEIKALICDNVDPYYGDRYIGTGRLNAYKALSALIQ